MKGKKQARIIDKETQITKQYIINSFYYDTINGEDYLVLDTEENGVQRFKLDLIDTFSLSSLPPN